MSRYLLVDPSSRLNFSHEWADEDNPWLEEGDTIASRLWTIEPSGGSPSPDLSNATSDIVFVSNLEAGKVYMLTETVTTASGLIDSRSIILRCDQT